MTTTLNTAWHVNYEFGLTTRQPKPLLDRPTTAYRILDLPDPLLRKAVAIHEAGHAVLALHLGTRLTSVSVADNLGREEGTAAGRTSYEPGQITPMRNVLLVSAAGERAQDRWLREKGLWSPERAWVVEILAAQDRSVIDQCVRPARPGGLTYGVSCDPTADLAALHDHVDMWLHGLWEQVTALADALNQRGTLTGAQAAAVTGLALGEGA
ncbi:hypothetical protein ACFVXG_07670 [Kitasatospora sp. NPDC058162]|uniref:hypothetical protein n=1 Tax=Kitasatospora sp. NPDC058162 TaxID=3346362 RepID=UPI0036DDA41A